MLRQFAAVSASVVSVLSGFAILAAPASAHTNFAECVAEAHRLSKGNTAQFEMMVAECDRLYSPKRKSLDGKSVAMSVPQGDRKPIPPLPGRDRRTAMLLDGNVIARRIVDTVQECGDDVALPAPDGRVECVPAPQVEEKQAVTPAPGCRVIGRSPRGPIIGCGEVAQVPDPDVSADEHDPSEVYPGLPPAPKVPTENLISMAFGEFNPPSDSGTPRNSAGSSGR